MQSDWLASCGEMVNVTALVCIDEFLIIFTGNQLNAEEIGKLAEYLSSIESSRHQHLAGIIYKIALFFISHSIVLCFKM